MRVLFPAPFSPTMASDWPAGTSRVSPSRVGRGAAGVGEAHAVHPHGHAAAAPPAGPGAPRRTRSGIRALQVRHPLGHGQRLGQEPLRVADHPQVHRGDHRLHEDQERGGAHRPRRRRIAQRAQDGRVRGGQRQHGGGREPGGWRGGWPTWPPAPRATRRRSGPRPSRPGRIRAAPWRRAPPGPASAGTPRAAAARPRRSCPRSRPFSVALRYTRLVRCQASGQQQRRPPGKGQQHHEGAGAPQPHGHDGGERRDGAPQHRRAAPPPARRAARRRRRGRPAAPSPAMPEVPRRPRRGAPPARGRRRSPGTAAPESADAQGQRPPPPAAPPGPAAPAAPGRQSSPCCTAAGMARTRAPVARITAVGSRPASQHQRPEDRHAPAPGLPAAAPRGRRQRRRRSRQMRRGRSSMAAPHPSAHRPTPRGAAAASGRRASAPPARARAARRPWSRGVPAIVVHLHGAVHVPAPPQRALAPRRRAAQRRRRRVRADDPGAEQGQGAARSGRARTRRGCHRSRTTRNAGPQRRLVEGGRGRGPARGTRSITPAHCSSGASPSSVSASKRERPPHALRGLRGQDDQHLRVALARPAPRCSAGGHGVQQPHEGHGLARGLQLHGHLERHASRRTTSRSRAYGPRGCTRADGGHVLRGDPGQGARQALAHVAHAVGGLVRRPGGAPGSRSPCTSRSAACTRKSGGSAPLAAAAAPRRRAARGRAARCSRMASAMWRTVAPAKRVATGRSQPSGGCTWVNRRSASSELPPRSKKLCVAPIPGTPQQLLPQLPRAAPPPRCAALVQRRSAAARTPARGGRVRSSLPVAVCGSASSVHEGGGHHVLRQRARAGARAAPAGVRARADHVRHQPPVAGPVLAHAPPGSRARRVPPQHRLDLAQLHAVAAHLHLVVDAPQDRQRRRPPASARGRRCGTSARRAPRRGRGRTSPP